MMTMKHSSSSEFSRALNLIVDNSGSMAEMSKLLLVKNLVSYVREFNDFTSCFDELKLLTLNECIETVELNLTEQTPDFVATGQADLSQLKAYFERILENANKLKVVFFTDGCFDFKQTNSFTKWLIKQSSIALRIVSVGPDADVLGIKKQFGEHRHYLAEDISTAIESLSL